MRRPILAMCLTLGCWALGTVPALAGVALDAVRRSGNVRGGVAFLSMPDSAGRCQGFDTEICRAVAAAVLGEAERVRFSAQGRFTAAWSGAVDVLTRTTGLWQ